MLINLFVESAPFVFFDSSSSSWLLLLLSSSTLLLLFLLLDTNASPLFVTRISYAVSSRISTRQFPYPPFATTSSSIPSTSSSCTAKFLVKLCVSVNRISCTFNSFLIKTGLNSLFLNSGFFCFGAFPVPESLTTYISRDVIVLSSSLFSFTPPLLNEWRNSRCISFAVFVSNACLPSRILNR